MSIVFMNKKNNTKRKRDIIKTLGWISFYGGFGQAMILPILPVFYASILGLNKETIGLIEGSLTTTIGIFRILSGSLSDKIGRRKSFIFVGYLVSAISRFLLGATFFVWQVFCLRLIDGIGKGTKDAPRDALVAQAARKGRIGFSFGYQQMLDTFGSVFGPLVTTLIFYLVCDKAFCYRIIFYVAGAISGVTIILIVFFIKENGDAVSKGQIKMDFSILKGKFLLFLIIMLIFTLGNSSDSFLILRSLNVGISPIIIPVVYAIFNFFYGALSLLAGSLSDKIGRVKVMKIGWLVYILSYIGFAFSSEPWQIWILFGFYGLYYATTEGIAKALVARMIPENKRATAFGLINASIGVMALPANLIAGYLWDKISPSAAFLFSALCALIAFVIMSFSKIENISSKVVD